MLHHPFRHHHLLTLLNAFDNQTLPIDVFMNHYFREHKALGSKDRLFIGDTAFDLIRWKGKIDAHLKHPNWETRLNYYLSCEGDIPCPDNAPLHIQNSFPLELFNLISQAYSQETTEQICFQSNQRAPTTLRVNTLKISRDDLIDAWKNKINVAPTTLSPVGLQLKQKQNLFGLEEFEKGYFEIQDESSQQVAFMVQARPGQSVLDYCCGSGGKTLAFAPLMKGKGQIYLHDIRSSVLQQAKKRLKRAGIENAQCILPEHKVHSQLINKMDWILVDAPCSGSGTLRRNPDMKWKFSLEGFQEVIKKQKHIFKNALSYLAPKGRIVWATCSLLPQENEEQIEEFMKIYGLKLSQPPLKTLPKSNGGDGFFAAVLERA